MKPRERGESLPPRQSEPNGRRLFWPMVVAVALVAWAGGVGAADLVIRIPGDLSQQDGFYRLDYRDINSRKIRYCRDLSPLVTRWYVDVPKAIIKLSLFWSARLPLWKPRSIPGRDMSVLRSLG